MKFSNILKHFILITKHRLLVFNLCCRIGEPWRGFVHDLSKYSPTEFWEGVKYFTGTHSPITECKKDIGYSKAWLHHKGRNKHHAQYWEDEALEEKNVLIPYKYAAEMVCDKLAAGMIYNGKNFKNSSEIEYYLKERKIVSINTKIDNFLIETFEYVQEHGVNDTLNKKNIMRLYNKNVYEKEDLKENNTINNSERMLDLNIFM